MCINQSQGYRQMEGQQNSQMPLQPSWTKDRPPCQVQQKQTSPWTQEISSMWPQEETKWKQGSGHSNMPKADDYHHSGYDMEPWPMQNKCYPNSIQDQLICWLCGETGHMSENCYYQKNNGIQCWECGIWGHKQKEHYQR